MHAHVRVCPCAHVRVDRCAWTSALTRPKHVVHKHTRMCNARTHACTHARMHVHAAAAYRWHECTHAHMHAHARTRARTSCTHARMCRLQQTVDGCGMRVSHDSAYLSSMSTTCMHARTHACMHARLGLSGLHQRHIRAPRAMSHMPWALGHMPWAICHGSWAIGGHGP